MKIIKKVQMPKTSMTCQNPSNCHQSTASHAPKGMHTGGSLRTASFIV